MNIVFATDLSTGSSFAEKLAARIAALCGDDLLLVHVVPPSWKQGLKWHHGDISDADDPLRSRAQHLLDMEGRFLRDVGCRVHTRIVTGSVLTELAHYTEDTNTRLSVVAMPNTLPLHTHRVVRALLASRKPVLVVPNVIGYDNSRIAGPWRIALAVRPNEGTTKTMHWLGTLPARLIEDVTAIRLCESRHDVTAAQHRPEATQSIVVQAHGCMEEQILKLSDLLGADVVAQTISSDNGWEKRSIAKLVAGSTMPVLLVPKNEFARAHAVSKTGEEGGRESSHR